MERFVVERGTCYPRIDFDPIGHQLVIKGESYPEDTATFYGPAMDWLESYLAQLPTSQAVRVDLELTYFNSSSYKLFLGFFDRLESAAQQGHLILVNWHYDSDNSAQEENGLEFKEDLKQVQFKLCPIPSKTP
ncbi:MAG: hypothetical protein A2508_10490 [Candidatus Lambdaproteobacteria bacterium RIFOXYD12_FULL_49_8]|nr:MAG: hypothetical protein A2508_10490 [Candidatus Lambdaproteobacteria bacterium RIFOXYD12_FULL_49_8]